MGEYAIFRGQEVKIGTCEEMYYLRWDQAHRVQAIRPSNVDPIGDRFLLRFRFPWPSEDHIEPGAFDDVRTVGISGVECPDGVEHCSVQFTSHVGYLLSVPCPEGTKGLLHAAALSVHKNGWGGNIRIASQKWLKGEDGHERLVTICQCGGCRTQFRLETYEMALPVILACRKMGGQRDVFWDTVADRIAAGYEMKK